MTEVAFAAEPSRLLIAAVAGIVLLLLLIIKFKLHPVLSLLISAMVIGLGAGDAGSDPGQHSREGRR